MSKISIERNSLAGALSLLSPIVSKKSVMPVLQCILFDFLDGKKLKLHSSDLESYISVCVDYKKHGKKNPDNFLLEFSKLDEIVKASEDSEIVIENKEDHAVVMEESSVYSLYGTSSLSSDSFPVAEFGDSTLSIDIDSKILLRAFDAVLFSRAKENARYMLASIMIEFKDGCMYIISSDSKRISYCKLDSDFTVTDGVVSGNIFLVPASFVVAVNKMCDSYSDDVSLIFCENMVKCIFNGVGVEMSSRLISGAYPPVHKIIPDLSTYKMISLDIESFSKSLKKSKIALGKEEDWVRFKKSKDGFLEISCDTGMHSYLDKIGVLNSSNFEGIDIAINPNYLLDYLKYINKFFDDDIVDFYYLDENNPIVVYKDFLTYGVMPLSFD